MDFLEHTLYYIIMWVNVYRYLVAFLVFSLAVAPVYSIPPVPDTEGSLTIWISSDISEYPLVLEVDGDTLELRQDATHNITLYAQGYLQKYIELYTPSPGDTLTLSLDPTILLIVDVFGRGFPDVNGAYVEVKSQEGRIRTITSANGKAYIYPVSPVGRELDIYVNPPFTEELWRGLIDAGEYEPSLRNLWLEFIGFESRSPIIPYNPGYNIEADKASKELGSGSIQTLNIYLTRGPTLSGYVKTVSGDVLPGAIVALKPDGFNRYLYTIADENGRYSFNQFVKGGLNRYAVIYRGLVTSTQSIFISLDRDNFNITVPDLYEVNGYVLDVNGRPIPGVRVSVATTTYASITYSRDDGSYTIYLPKGGGEYLVGLGMGDILFRNVILEEADIMDGVENITLAAEMILLSGRVYDEDGFKGLPILRVKGVIPSINRVYRVDIPLSGDGGFSVYVPKNISIFGDYRVVEWGLEMVDYYYKGSLSTPLSYYDMDTDLGAYEVDPMPTIEISLDITFNGLPPQKPMDSYIFTAWYNETSFQISMETNASIYGFGIGSFTVDGGVGVFTVELSTPPTMDGLVRITLPKNIISTSLAITIDDSPAPYSIVSENATHFTIEFTISGKVIIEISSTQVIPEFSPSLILLAVLTILVIVLRRRFE